MSDALELSYRNSQHQKKLNKDTSYLELRGGKDMSKTSICTSGEHNNFELPYFAVAKEKFELICKRRIPGMVTLNESVARGLIQIRKSINNPISKLR